MCPRIAAANSGIGGAGYVGVILRPTLEEHHDCTFMDLRPVAGARGPCLIGPEFDVNVRGFYRFDTLHQRHFRRHVRIIDWHHAVETCTRSPRPPFPNTLAGNSNLPSA